MGRKHQYSEIATWLAWHGDKDISPEARLLTQHVMAYFQPEKPAYMYPPEEMLVQYLAWTPEQVQEGVEALLSSESFLTLTLDEKSVLWGKYELTARGQQARDEWIADNRSHPRPQEMRWKDGFNAVMKYELRYNPYRGRNVIGDLLALMLASWHGLDRTESKLWKPSMLADVLGITVRELVDVLPYLHQRGWETLLIDEGLETAPSDELIEAWEELAEVLRNPKGGGASETSYASEGWGINHTNGIVRKDTVQELGSLDYLPATNEWLIYRVSSELDGRRYLGITSRPLRERGIEHLNRKGLLGEKEYNPAMATLYVEHQRAGLEPRIELIETVRGNRTWAEKVEHRLVVQEVQNYGGDVVLNIEHHPETAHRCNH